METFKLFKNEIEAPFVFFQTEKKRKKFSEISQKHSDCFHGLRWSNFFNVSHSQHKSKMFWYVQDVNFCIGCKRSACLAVSDEKRDMKRGMILERTGRVCFIKCNRFSQTQTVGCLQTGLAFNAQAGEKSELPLIGPRLVGGSHPHLSPSSPRNPPLHTFTWITQICIQLQPLPQNCSNHWPNNREGR